MRVAIIDDSPSALQAHTEMLRAIKGCDVIAFQESAAALQWCMSNSVDLVVVDYNMPPPDGLQFIHKFRGHPRCAEVPVIMVTACGERDVRRRALRLGATDFLTKPVDEVEFLARVRNSLKMYQSHLALADRAQWLGREVAKATQSIVDREREAILILSRAAEFRDPETAHHLVRMAGYCRLISLGLGQPKDAADLILAAAPMHDIGKIGIPDHILLKPGPLTADEQTLMRRHCAFGADILSGGSAPLIKTAATIARSHHERFDGTGYPNGLADGLIPIVGRIAGLADVFDALTSDRPYKKAWPLMQARQYVEEQSGRHFDPECVAAFLRQWDTVVELAGKYRDQAACSGPIEDIQQQTRNLLFWTAGGGAY
ncbi:MAG TPA: HD domain-containing phosphohydrolase [Magnetospirillum sp.]|nr:HD domain-containing phosphohydrolase [Magnetospirillum sp.]